MSRSTSSIGEVRLRALVQGRVQGVGFRWFVLHHAQELRVTGWARNITDGRTVEVVAEGVRSSLEQLLEYLWVGPASAHVANIDAEWNTSQKEFTSFQIG